MNLVYLVLNNYDENHKMLQVLDDLNKISQLA